MTPGIKEIVILLLAVVALFVAPRMVRRGGKGRSFATGHSAREQEKSIGLLRLAVFVSVVWVVAAALLIRPWEARMILFLGAGVVPVAAGWGIRWVLQGFR